ncbi:MAG: proteasome endopeptidase complex, archaeal, beta subunit [Thermoprotei archaeon]|nr:MAG: proteasome endopeptidase complex, archaeal, beta subunit [Thermoprotei archaeon]
MSYDEYHYAPGATVVGLVFDKGIVLAAEKRVTYGFSLMSKAGKKVYKINDRVGIACAGLIADMQMIAKTLAAEVNLYELETKKILSIRGVAKLLSVILFNRRLMPYFAETVVGGIDDTGPHIFVLDPLGSLIEDKYAALGTGAKIAIGILETEYSENITAEKAKSIAIKAIKTAISRDAVSGDGIDLLVISGKGAEEIFVPLT